MQLVESAKQALAAKDLAKLDDVWTEMILDGDTQLSDFFAIAQMLKQSHESERALMLLEMLATHLESNKKYHDAREVYTNMLYYAKKNDAIRRKIVGLYKSLHAGSTHLEQYMELSGLTTGEPIFRALDKLDEFIAYDIGNLFYFDRYGVGEVIEVRPTSREIVVDFEQKKRHFLKIDVARGLLTPLNTEHFLYKKQRNIDTLKQMSEKEPCALVMLILKSFKVPMTAKQIKGHLGGVVDTTNLGTFWEKVKKELEKVDTVHITGRTTKKYAYSEIAIDKVQFELSEFNKASAREQYLRAEEYARKKPSVFAQITPTLTKIANTHYHRDPALALDIFMLFDDMDIKEELVFTVDTLFEKETPLSVITKMQNAEHQKRSLQMIQQKRPEIWKSTFKDILFSTDDFKLLDTIAELLETEQEILKDVYYTIFSVPKQHQHQFQWMLKKIEGGDLPDFLQSKFLPRLIDSLNYTKGVKGVLNRILTHERFDTLMSSASDSEAERVIEALESSAGLPEYKKKDFLKIIEYHFPQFFKKESTVIWTTEPALDKKKEELRHIVDVEIPQNKKDIGRAREFGDLSENFEYKSAKEKQDQLYQKLRLLETEIRQARVIDSSTIKTDVVNIGTKTSLQDKTTGTITQYAILGKWDSDLEHNIISYEAPLAQTLLGKMCGDEVTIDDTVYEIIEITRAL